MKNFEVARLFNLKDENPFRIRAYRRAAQNLESLTEDVEALLPGKGLDDIPGIGGLKRLLLGSVAARVVGTAPCPVLSVHAR